MLAATGNCLGVVEIPYTRQSLPVRCEPGNCFYVDGVNGSDSSDGTTLQNAWKTLQKAHDAIPDGATVLVADGVYTPGVADGRTALYTTKSGTPDRWLTFAALPGHRPTVDVPKGSWGAIHIAKSHHLLIDGFEFRGRAQSMTRADVIPVADPNERCVSIGGGDLPVTYAIVIRNSVIHDCPGGGLMQFAGDSVYILENHIYNNGWYAYWGGGGINIIHQATSAQGVDIGGYRAYVVGNLVERNWNYFPMTGGTGKICDGHGIIVDDNNHTQPSRGPGDVTGVQYSGRTYIANNIVRDSGSQGLNSFQSLHVDVVNNTVYNSMLTEDCNERGEIHVFASGDIRVVNNVAINLNGKEALQANANAANVVFDFNVWDGGVPTTVQTGAHDIREEARLTDPAGGNFTPTPVSPAVRNSGTDQLAPAIDFFGNRRPPTQIDRGAVQLSGVPGPTAAVEFFHRGFGHYVISANPEEIAKLDTGVFEGWARTGHAFGVYRSAGANLAAVCRFFTTAFPPKSSHFYAPRGLGCEGSLRDHNWQFEGDVFFVRLPDASGGCPTGTLPVYRLYNAGQGGAPNHRFTTSASIRADMVASGYIAEGAGVGVGMCAPALPAS